MNIYLKHYGRTAGHALLASGLIMSVLLATFLVIEPAITHGQTFYVRQTITGETSFLVLPSNVTTDNSIAGITGGSATGTTQFVVQSNNSAGYYVEIDFFDNVGDHAMLGDVTGDESLRDYSGATMEPSFGYNASTAAQFSYQVRSTTTSDTDQSFMDNGANCNQSGGTYNDSCWMAPSTTAFRIVDRSATASTGATSTIYFNVVVPSNPIPLPAAETYTATVTLSLIQK